MADDTSYSPLKYLHEQRKIKLVQRRKVQFAFYMSLVLIIATTGISVFFFPRHFDPDKPFLNTSWFMPLLYALLLMCMLPMSRSRLRELEQDLQSIDFEIDLEQYEVGKFERRAEKILRINQIQLQQYYDTNLRQNREVFAIGILCIAAGIAIIVTTLFLVVKAAGTTDEKIIISALGAVGSILSNFVAAVYLKMHAAATSTLTSFHQRLINSQSLFLGNLLASRIEDPQIRTKTLAELAMRVVGGETKGQ
jgi:hypothetical protein